MSTFEINRQLYPPPPPPSPPPSCHASPDTQEVASGEGSAPAAGLPDLFTQEWHPQYGARLAVFPRYLPGSRHESCDGYWPDFSTLVEDTETRQMMYFPVGPSSYSVQLICVLGRSESVVPRYRMLKYKDATLLDSWEAEECHDALAEMMAPRTVNHVPTSSRNEGDNSP